MKQIEISEVIYLDNNVPKEKLREFDADDEVFNNYLWNLEMKYGEVLHLVVENKTNRIIAYYSLMASSIEIRGNCAPAIEINMISVDKNIRGYVLDESGYTFAQSLMDGIFTKIYNLSESIIGVRYIIAYIVPRAYNYYCKCGFVEFTKAMSKRKDRFIDGCIPMYYDLEA